jgi:hypothetical protein
MLIPSLSDPRLRSRFHLESTRVASVGVLVFVAFFPFLFGAAASESTIVGPLTQGAALEQASAGTFTFAAAGDHAAGSRANASLAALDQSGASFYLALGDLDYDATPTDEAWCDYVLQRLPTLGSTFPFQLVSGNHEQQGGSDGYIMNHAACLPDRLNSTGTYAAQYYFDYPAQSPLIRVIMIAPDLLIENVDYVYAAGDAHYNWLAAAIDGARNAGIPWVAVGMHKVCITTGVKVCEIGKDLMNLLVSKRVDLVLQGHDHNYQRSNQLAHGPGCPSVPAGSFDPDCVQDNGIDGQYPKGAGTVFIITGSFGQCCYAVSAGDSEAPYFAAFSSASSGLTQFSVGPARIDARFLNTTGAFTDSFSIASDLDSDGDGASDGIEAYAGTDPAQNCGPGATVGPPSPAWTADLNTEGLSANRIDLQDLGTYVAPESRLNRSVGQPGYDLRWDLNADGTTGIADMAVISILHPPMLNYQRAYGGPACVP